MPSSGLLSSSLSMSSSSSASSSTANRSLSSLSASVSSSSELSLSFAFIPLPFLLAVALSSAANDGRSCHDFRKTRPGKHARQRPVSLPGSNVQLTLTLTGLRLPLPGLDLITALLERPVSFQSALTDLLGVKKQVAVVARRSVEGKACFFTNSSESTKSQFILPDFNTCYKFTDKTYSTVEHRPKPHILPFASRLSKSFSIPMLSSPARHLQHLRSEAEDISLPSNLDRADINLRRGDWSDS